MSDEKKARTEIQSLGEFGLIERLTKTFRPNQKSTLKAVGDDAAVLEYGDNCLVVTTDMFVEGIHFDLMYSPLKHLGYKSIAANVSDVCAMNAVPRQVTVSIAISNRFSVEALEELYDGIKAACSHYKVDLVGGDTTSSNKGLIISVTAIGETEKSSVTFRSGAKVGDLICCTGDLGAAYLGLQILEREKQIYLANPGVQPDLGERNHLVEKILKPEARTDMVAAFRKNKLIPTSMIDISDGLASEIHHICSQSNVGAYIEESGVPIHPDAQMQAIDFGLDPITCALSGGEDYELLFTIDPEDVDKVKFLPDIYIMGEVVSKEEGIRLHTKGGNIHPITSIGWEHFQPTPNSDQNPN
ncbi:MAG: thiamine-phosphate kinase [Saprospiraceae bacterium]|nr:thiamine-phosphate kinase [Saprospiraceae bacterium]